MGELHVTMADVQVLVERNPLAAEQLKSIALERMLLEKDAEIAALRSASARPVLGEAGENGKGKEPVGETVPISGA